MKEFAMCMNLQGQLARRAAVSTGAWLAGLVALLACWSAPLKAQPPVGPTDIAAAEKVGVTLFQVNGFNGKIPLKKVYHVDPAGDSGHYELDFASAGMNTKMEWKAKFVIPPGMIFKSFEVFTANGPIQITPASADTWDGQKIIDEVTLSPWSLNHVLQQCKQQLTNPDGTFKDSATFDLQASEVEVVRGKGICTFPNAPPGSASSSSGKATPKTRVTAYIVGGAQHATGSPEAKKLTAERSTASPTRLPASRPTQPAGPRGSGGGASVKKPALGTLVLPTGGGTAAKDRFERTKPHVNAASEPLQLRDIVPVKPLRAVR
jgi:hypothetical protein